jgi:hypothetical protein
MSCPAPGAFVGVVGRKLFDNIPVFLHDKYLLTAIAPKGIGEGDGREATPTATGAGVLSLEVNLLDALGLHRRFGE